MKCLICEKDPSSHSFNLIKEIFVTEEKQSYKLQVYYCCPSKATKYYEYAGVLEHFRIEFENLGEKQWIWIFDCSDFTASHATQVYSAIEIAKMVLKKADTLKKIYIINKTGPLDIFLNIIYYFLTDKLKKRIIFSDLKTEDIIKSISNS